MRRSSVSISSTTICAACSMKPRSASPVARHHLFHGEADGRQRVLHLVRHLARQRLPTGELAQVDQPLGALLQLVGHVVEGLDGAADFVVAGGFPRERSGRRRRVSRGLRSIAGWAADAVRHVNQQSQGDEPERGGDQNVGALEAARGDRGSWRHPPVRGPSAISLFKRSRATPPRPASRTRSRRRAAPGSSRWSPSAPACRKLFALGAFGERSARHPARPPRSAGRYFRGCSFAGLRLALEIVASPLVQFAAGCVSDFESVSTSSAARSSPVCSSSDVVNQTVAASGASVAARKIRMSLLRRRFTRFSPPGPAYEPGPPGVGDPPAASTVDRPPQVFG